MTRRADGTLACPDDAAGLTSLELDKLNAQARPAVHLSEPGGVTRREPAPWEDIAGCLFWVDARRAEVAPDGSCTALPDAMGGAPFVQQRVNARWRLGGTATRYLYAPRTGHIALSRTGQNGAPFATGPYTVVMRGSMAASSDYAMYFEASSAGLTALRQTLARGVFSATVAAGLNLESYVPSWSVGWNSLAVVWTGTALTFYVNGASDYVVANAFTIPNPPDSLSVWTIGNLQGTTTEIGTKIGCVGAFDTALTAAQIASIHTYGAGEFA